MSLFNQTNVTNFVLDVPDAGITHAFSANVQTALIPGVSIPVTDVPLGQGGIGRAKVPGSTFEFEPLMVRVLVDENLDAWVDLLKWMISLNNYQTLDSNGWEPGVLPEFISLHILDNSKTKIVMSVHYYGAWPSSLSDLEYSFAEDADPAIFVNATFNYRYFAVEKNGVIIETRESMNEKFLEKRTSVKTTES